MCRANQGRETSHSAVFGTYVAPSMNTSSSLRFRCAASLDAMSLPACIFWSELHLGLAGRVDGKYDTG